MMPDLLYVALALGVFALAASGCELAPGQGDMIIDLHNRPGSRRAAAGHFTYALLRPERF